MTQLTDAELSRLVRTNPNDPHAPFKHQQHRQLMVELDTMRKHLPRTEDSSLAESRAKVAQLERLIEDAKVAHHRTFGTRSLSQGAQQSLQALDRLAGQLDLAQSRVRNLELAIADRESLPPTAA